VQQSPNPGEGGENQIKVLCDETYYSTKAGNPLRS
jgi:hypothetical protein